MLTTTALRRSGGFSLIEVLVTLVLMVIGLVGLLGLQSRAAGVELESYQRGQALTLVRDLATRIANSRGLVQGGTGFLSGGLSSADGSVYVGVLGNGTTDLGADCAVNPAAPDIALERATFEMCEWSRSIRGSAENGSTGAMLQARGCLIRNDPGNGSLADFYVVVVWRGVAAGKEPLGTAGEAATPASMCAAAVDFGPGLRRGVSLRVMVPNLAQV